MNFSSQSPKKSGNKKMPFHKYRPFARVDLQNRRWPDRTLTTAPVWCSVDLRDGNQALIDPMLVEQKLIFFDELVKIGFKEIEVGFPAASVIEFDFLRRLIEENRIPDDVTIQVLCQARPNLIDRTVEALAGCKNSIFHLYNSTSTLQRKVVFNTDRAGVKKIATDGTACVKEAVKKLTDCNLTFQYSPESFTGTELDYTLEVLEAVSDIWEPDLNNKIILNLPATVEMSTPNIYADMIEWISTRLSRRDKTILSVHTHNDRGSAVAATELALLAGAERVEGTLFGNGERTGNVDIVTLACNLYSQGVDPKLDFTDIGPLVKICNILTKLPVHPRHPYAGDLVYTAFSGSHQDAIRKGMANLKNQNNDFWEVPYLPIDPEDLGRIYEPIRINSQSGKGGVAFVLEHRFGYRLPKGFHLELSRIIQRISETTGKEVPAEVIKEEFEKAFVNIAKPLKLIDFDSKHHGEKSVQVSLEAAFKEEKFTCNGSGNGPLDALADALKRKLKLDFDIKDYMEHTLGLGSDAQAACYITIDGADKEWLGVGVHSDTNRASFLALVSATNRYLNHNQD